MLRALLRLRYMAAVVAIVFALNGAAFLALGVVQAADAFVGFAKGHGQQGGPDRPGIHLTESVDLLLFALMLIVLALGTASLFLTKEGQAEQEELPDWMRVSSLTELKLLLWEAILASLVVAAATSVISDLPHVTWQHLVLPVVILILSVSYFLLKYAEQRKH